MTTDFKTWSQESLLKFAFEATQKIAEQTQEIKHLQDDLKAALKAYRELNIKGNVDDTGNKDQILHNEDAS